MMFSHGVTHIASFLGDKGYTLSFKLEKGKGK